MTNQSDIATRLGAVALFEHCTKRDLRIVARHAERLTVPAGTQVVCQGDKGDAFFLLLHGSATAHRDGRCVATLGPGDCFGELALLDPAPRAATVTTTQDTELLVLGARMFNVLLRELPVLSAALLRVLAHRLCASSRSLFGLVRLLKGPSCHSGGMAVGTFRYGCWGRSLRIRAARWSILAAVDSAPSSPRCRWNLARSSPLNGWRSGSGVTNPCPLTPGRRCTPI